MDDSSLYTGVDGVELGQFGNESIDETTKVLLEEQKKFQAEVTPQLEAILEMLDSEIKEVMSIDRFTTAAAMKSEDLRAEIQASALYKQYIEGLKTKFRLQLQESKK